MVPATLCPQCQRSVHIGLGGLLIALVLLSGCASPSPVAGGPTQEAHTPRQKVLVILRTREFVTFADFVGGTTAAGGNTLFRRIAHDYLTVEDEFGVRHPKLALELPSVERGTWQVNPDGTMDMEWRIRPNVRWHDGTPFTTADLLFSFQLHTDPDFALSTGAATIRQMESASAPDPYTLRVHWKQVVNNADAALGLDPLPRHLLEELYRTDKQSLTTSSLLDRDFVGLGPYRIAEMVPGVETTFTRFADYDLGVPPLDRIVVKQGTDANAMVAAILAGEVDVVLAHTVEITAALEVKRRWEGTGNQVTLDIPGSRVRFVRIQFSPEYARPRNGFRVLPVRQAFYYAMDREQFALVHGGELTPAADSWVRPDHPWRPRLETAIPRYPYDPARALRLLEEAGWTRGSDGRLVHVSGERFEAPLRARTTGGTERDAVLIQHMWGQIGAEISIETLTAAQSQDRVYQAQAPLATLSAGTFNGFNDIGLLHSSQIGTRERPGQNWGNYANPKVDAILDRIFVTVDERERISLYRELLQEALGDMAAMPMYWDAEPQFLLKGVSFDGWNAFLWDKV